MVSNLEYYIPASPNIILVSLINLIILNSTTMIPLGYRIQDQNSVSKIGFKREEYVPKRRKLIVDKSEAHMLTLARTGSGKGRCNIIPTCLTYPGSLIVFDVKGEAATVTAEVRRKFGEVVLIDPFKIVTENPGRFNPMDVSLGDRDVDQAGVMLAKAFQGDNITSKGDTYWDNAALELLTGLTIHELTQQKSFSNLRKTLFVDDVDFGIAKMMDEKVIKSTFAYELLAAYLQIPSDKTRPCVLSSAQQYIGLLGDAAVLQSLEGPSSFNVIDLINGKPLTIYFIIPPNKLKAYNVLLKLWVTSLLHLFTERTHKPLTRTLMIIDECSNLGAMDSLVTAITLMRSYGLRLWTLFQSLGQIKSAYPNDWSSIIANCDVIQAFGFSNYLIAKETSETFGGFTPNQLLSMPVDEAVLIRSGHRIEKMKKLDYLNDKMFRHLGYKDNPFYGDDKNKA